MILGPLLLLSQSPLYDWKESPISGSAGATVQLAGQSAVRVAIGLYCVVGQIQASTAGNVGPGLGVQLVPGRAVDWFYWVYHGPLCQQSWTGFYVANSTATIFEVFLAREQRNGSGNSVRL